MTENQQKDDNQKNGNPIKSIVSSAKDVKCPICLTTITNLALTDTCVHEFCFDCISQWSANHNRCPICRQIYSNIKYNIVSNDMFDEMAVEEQLGVDDDEIEAILHRMLLYLRLIGLRNRTQRRRDASQDVLTTSEQQIKESNCSQRQKKELRKKIKELRSEIRRSDEDIRRFNHTLSAESPSEEELMEVLNGSEEVHDIEVIDLIFDPEELIEINGEDVAEDESFDSLPSLVSDDDSGNESDDEREPEIAEEVRQTRKRKPSQHNRNTDSDDSGQSTTKRKRNKRQ